MATSRKVKAGSVTWDEQNLLANDVIKQQLNPCKIDEPKTPYVHGVDGHDELDSEAAGMSPLRLDGDTEDEDEVAARAAQERHFTEQLIIECNSLMGSVSGTVHAGGAAGINDAGQGAAGASPRHLHTHVSFTGSANEDGDYAEEGSDTAVVEKRRSFEQHRKQHYNMRTALQRGRELVADDPPTEG